MKAFVRKESIYTKIPKHVNARIKGARGRRSFNFLVSRMNFFVHKCLSLAVSLWLLTSSMEAMFCRSGMATVVESDSGSGDSNILSLESIRESLIRQEDTIVFSLIERAKFPLNSLAFEESHCLDSGNSSSLTEFLVRETEILQAKVGRYENPEENPFFLEDIPISIFPIHKYPLVLHPKSSSVNINKRIWDVYFKELLPLFVKPGDDGNYPSTAASDLVSLQALSRRIHYGKFVAEVKFRDAPHDYEPAIRAQDREALIKLLTFEKVEKMVKKRVQKKAEMFGQEVKCNNGGDESEKKYKVDPLLVSRIYGEWLIPLTKLVEVEYLLRRLD